MSRAFLPGTIATLVALGCTGPDRTFPEGSGGSGSTSSDASSSGAPTGSGSSSVSTGPGGGSSSASSSTSGGEAGAGPSSSSGDGGSGTGGDPGVGGSGGQGAAGGQGGEGAQGGGGGGTGGEGVGGEGGRGPVCAPATHVCVDSPPVEWTGPFALYDEPTGGSVPSCGGTAYPATVGDLDGGFQPGAASCQCQCDDAEGIACTTSVGVCQQNGSCITACFGTTFTVPPNVCMSVNIGNTANLVVYDPAPTDMGSCDPIENHTLPTPTFDREAKACGGATTTPLGCDAGDVCAPRAFAPFDTLCIAHAGDVACPAGTVYTDKRLLHEGFSDTRDCSACSCGGAVSECNGEVFFAQNPCTQQQILIDVVQAGSCVSFPDEASVDTAEYAPDPSGTCPPQGGALSGTATPTGAVTYCCAP